MILWGSVGVRARSDFGTTRVMGAAPFEDTSGLLTRSLPEEPLPLLMLEPPRGIYPRGPTGGTVDP